MAKRLTIGFGMILCFCVLLGQSGEVKSESFAQQMQFQKANWQPSKQTETIALDSEPLKLARKLIQSAREALSPIEILKRGDRKQAMMRALRILEKDQTMGSLWSLLLAWVCQIEGDLETSEIGLKVLKEVWKGERVAPTITGWQGDVAAFLLGELREVDDEIVGVASAMLEDHNKSQVIGTWVKRGFFTQALKLAETERGEWLRKHNFADIAVALVKANRFEEAIKVAKALPNASERLFALTNVANAMAEAGKDVSSLLEEIKKGAKGLRPDVWLLSKIAFVFAKLGREEEALQLAQKVVHDERTQVLGEIVKALSQRQLFERAMEILKAPEFEHGMGYWFKGEATVAIAKGLAQAGKFDEAQKLVRQSHFRFGGLIAIAKVAAEQGKKDFAEKIFSELLAEATDWNELFSIAFAQAKVEFDAAPAFEKALETVKKEIEKLREWSPNPLIGIAIRMASLGLTEKAMEIASLMEKTSDRIEASANVAIEIAKRGDVQKALQYFGQVFLELEEEEVQRAQHKADEVLEFLTKEMVQKKMLKEAEQIAQLVKTEPFRSRAIAEVAKAKVKSGQIEDALNLAQKVRTLNELVYIAEAMAKAGKVKEALKILAQVEDDNERDQGLYQLAKQLAEAGKFADAFIVVHAIREKGRGDALGRIAIPMAKAGKFAEALKIARKIEHPGFRASVLTDIITQMTKAGKMEEALKVAKAEKDTGTRAWMLRDIARILVHKGQWKKAIQIAKEIPNEWAYLLWLSEAVEIACAQKRPETLSLVRQLKMRASRHKEPTYLATAAKVLAMMDRTKEADQVFGEAIKVARSIKDESARSNALKFISTELAEVGRFDRAIKIAIEISDKYERFEAISWALGEMAEAGKVNDAVRHAGCLSEKERDGILVHIASVYSSLPLARAVKNLAKRAEALKEVAKGFYWREYWFGKKGKRKEAEKVFEEALLTAKQIPDFAQRIKQLWEIAIALANTGFFEKAVSLAESLPMMHGEKLPTLLRILAGEGKRELCYRLIPLCHEDLMLAYEGCLAIARLFPNHAVDIAQLMLGNLSERRE